MAFNKLFFIVLGIFLATISASAQGVPSGINYQAVLRNNEGEIIASQPIRLRISVFNPDARDYYYTESHQVITNQVGIFTLVVGGGTPEKGKFADIPWSTANTWLEVSYDTDNNGTYEVTGSTQMLSVPYAFYAERAGTADQSVKNGNQSADGDEGDVIGENDWQLKGNLEVDETINFLGSKNYADLIFKTHDTERMRITKGFASDQHDAQVQIKEDVLAEQDVWVLGMLTVEGETLLNGDLTVVGDAVFKKNMIIGQDLDIDGFLHVKKDADFDANVNIDVNLHVGNDVDIDHNLNVDNDTHIGSDLDVDGNGNIDVDLHVGRDADIDRNLNVDNDTHIGSDLDVDGNGNIDMNLHVGKDADIDNNLNVDNDTHIGSDLDVDGNGNIDMNLHVGKDADIDNDLNVDEDVHIGNDLDVDHNVNIDNDLTVRNNASILGDLDVDGTGTFLDLVVERDLSVGRDADIDRNLNVDVDVHIGNNLDVDNNINVDNSVHIGVNLDVDNNINVDNSINVDQNVTVNNNLYVDNNTTINNNLNVTNDVYVGGTLQVENPITANCRLVVNSCVSGDDQTLDNYPVLVQGGSQGIAIKVDGSRSSANNYASFWDDNGMQGRIEGQTYGELTTSFDFIWSNAMSAAHEALAIAMAIACGFQLDFGEVAVWGAEAAIITAEWVVYNVEITNKVGVLFESGSGDYAEWLERENPGEDINFGEIVGVKGGRISRNTQGADHIMVVSMSPIVLGNMPPAAKEKDFEKVAFMGQVPVRVMGKVAIGDYIVASGNNDGYAKAIHPKYMRPEDFAQMVGVAWQSGESFPMNVVNVAVGINSQDWVGKAMEQQKNIDALSLQVSDMQQKLNQLYALLGQTPPYPIAATPVNLQVKAEVTSPSTPPVTESNTTNVKLELAELLNQHGDVFVQSFAKARERLVEKGIDVNKFPEVATIYQDPVNWIRVQNEKGYLDELYLQVKQKAKK